MSGIFTCTTWNPDRTVILFFRIDKLACNIFLIESLN